MDVNAPIVRLGTTFSVIMCGGLLPLVSICGNAPKQDDGVRKSYHPPGVVFPTVNLRVRITRATGSRSHPPGGYVLRRPNAQRTGLPQ